MLTISGELQARLDSGATRLCWCWRVTRADGAVFGFTEHDCDLTVEGLVYRASTGLVPGEIDREAGFAADQASVFGALNAETITEADLAKGVWDNARVDVLRADWSDPSLFVTVWTGELGEIRRGDIAFEADLAAPSYRLEQTIGRLYSRRCDAELGDARCRVDLADPAFAGAGVVTRVMGPAVFEFDGFDGLDSGLFENGILRWTGGANAGAVSTIRVHRTSGLTAIIEIDGAPANPVMIGDGGDLTAGCDKRLTTCRDRFANAVNFQGFPFIPGNDALIAAPASQSPRDGSSRGLGQ